VRHEAYLGGNRLTSWYSLEFPRRVPLGDLDCVLHYQNSLRRVKKELTIWTTFQIARLGARWMSWSYREANGPDQGHRSVRLRAERRGDTTGIAITSRVMPNWKKGGGALRRHGSSRAPLPGMCQPSYEEFLLV
jgi:hypothetical protein